MDATSVTLKSVKQIAKDSDMGLAAVRRISREAHADRWIGRRQFVVPELFYSFIAENYKQKPANVPQADEDSE